MLDQIRANFDQSLERVENLVAVYESHPDARGQGRKKAQVLDILRSAVVLLHATLEEMLRGIAEWKLPLANPAALNEIPLVGHGPSGKKFTLGDLSGHRGKSVDSLLAESVNAYLERSNYNNTNEINGLLQNLALDVTKVNGRFALLEDLMKRRHQIVHRGDRQKKVKGSGDHKIRPINKVTVKAWIVVVRAFGNDLFTELK